MELRSAENYTNRATHDSQRKKYFILHENIDIGVLDAFFASLIAFQINKSRHRTMII